MKNLAKNNNAQILIVASIIIAVMLVTIGVITANLSNVNVNLPSEKSYSIYNNYIDIRQKFGTALYQRLYYVSNDEMIESYFDDVAYEFSNIVNRHGNYFYAEFVSITYTYNDYHDGIIVKIGYRSDTSSIDEEVEYNIW